jgi:hypothetical protein
MKNFKIKVGDLVKLRDDLEDGKIYGVYYRDFMRFNDFKQVESLDKVYDMFTLKKPQNYYHYTKEMIAEVKRPKYETIYKREDPILDKEEKEYLSSVIRPFRDKIKNIAKITVSEEKEYISISLNNDTVLLPNFKRNTMYKNMEANKEYTLEELGL